MDDFSFMNAALNIGLALNKDRQREDFLRSRGHEEEANKIYFRNKEEARILFSKLNMTAAEFDSRFAKLARKNRVRVNVKLERLFG